MGADGGTRAVVRRFFRGAKGDDLDKKKETVDKEQTALNKATNCALSGKELSEPIVACKLGFLYNKEDLFKALLEKSLDEYHSHIKRARDTINCVMTKNPDYPEKSKIKFICPITQQLLNGINPFAVIVGSGQVVSMKAISEVEDLTKDDEFIKLFPTEDEVKARRAAIKAPKLTKEPKKKKRKIEST